MRTQFFATMVVMLSCAVAGAVPVEPGQTIEQLTFPEWVPPTAGVIAENTQPVTFNYVLPEGYTASPNELLTFDGELRSRVLRDESDQSLTFLYEFVAPGDIAVAAEGNSISVSSFNGFTTDVNYREDDVSGLARSAD